MKIGLDFDGVMADSPSLKQLVGQKIYKITIPISDFRRKNVSHSTSLNLEKYDVIQREVYYNPELLDLLKPVPQALESIETLQKTGHTLSIITARSGKSESLAKKWASQYSIDLPMIGVGRESQKAQVVDGFDVFVDDAVSNLVPFLGKVESLFLFSWPYNENDALPDKILRVNSWPEIVDEIQKLN